MRENEYGQYGETRLKIGVPGKWVATRMAAGCRARARRSQEKFSLQPWKFVLNGSSHLESEIE
jgi:hypothetical protein